jgi:hypothetical protein
MQGFQGRRLLHVVDFFLLLLSPPHFSDFFISFEHPDGYYLIEMDMTIRILTLTCLSLPAFRLT